MKLLNAPYRALALLAGLLCLSGCITKIVANQDVTSLSDLGPDQILVVGKIELLRPLVENEQILKPRTASSLKDKAYLVMDKEGYDLNNIPVMAANKATGVVTLGKTFFLAVNRGQSLRYSGGVIVINDDALFRGNTIGGIYGIWNLVGADHFRLPGGLKYSYAKTDRAVYIGTLQYYRDDFNVITNVKTKDEYAQANAELKKRYSPAFALKKVTPEK